MINNKSLLNNLCNNRKIRINRSALFDTEPSPPMKYIYRDRIEGMMLGLAIGDALGNTTEGMLANERREKYGEIRDYLSVIGGINLSASHRMIRSFPFGRLNRYSMTTVLHLSMLQLGSAKTESME